MPTPIYPGDHLPDDNGHHDSKGLLTAEMLVSEIRRREQMLLNFHGELCTIYVAKDKGPTCLCYRDYQGQSLDPDCPICFGSGVIGGYDQLTTERFVDVMHYAGLSRDGEQTLVSPNYTYVDQLTEKEIHTGKFLFRFPPVEGGITNDKLRLFDAAEVRIWGTLTAVLKPRDIVVRGSGERYRVKAAKPVRNIRGIFTHQKLSVQQIDEADSSYRIGMTPVTYQQEPEFEERWEPATIRENGGLFLLEQTFDLLFEELC